jgi:hypothetical protein
MFTYVTELQAHVIDPPVDEYVLRHTSRTTVEELRSTRVHPLSGADVAELLTTIASSVSPETGAAPLVAARLTAALLTPELKSVAWELRSAEYNPDMTPEEYKNSLRLG